MNTIKLNPELAKKYGVENLEEYGDMMIPIANQTIMQNLKKWQTHYLTRKLRQLGMN